MSNDSSDPSNGPDSGLDLSNLNFGPAWARDDKESKTLKKFKDRGDRDDQRRGGGGDRRGGGGRGPGRGRDDRGGGGGGRNFQGGRGGRGGDRKGGRFDDRRQQRVETPAPEGFTLKLMPLEESLDVLANQIKQDGRTYSVFNLAKVCLQGRDRFRAIYESKDQKFYRCREDDSLWLTKEEAVRQLWRGDWLNKYYIAVQTEGEAPKGAFSSVAKCGFSGEYLGPPNYHGYQQNIATLHRERFAHMSIDRYKSKVVMERSEEAVEAWLESMKTVTKWREVTKADLAARKAAAEKEKEEAAQKEAAEAKPEEVVSENAVTEEQSENVEAPVVEPSVESVSEEAVEKPEETATPESASEEAVEASDSSSEDEAAPAEPSTVDEEPSSDEPAPEVPLFATSREVEHHFLQHHFNKAFEQTNRSWVLGNIQGKMLSPGLLTLLKDTVLEEKRYPASLMPVVCRQLSGRHLAVFKWQKKLKVGPSRPRAAADDLKLAERPQAILDYLKENSGKEVAQLWETLMPKDATDEQKHEWYHDLHWLLNQGHAILLSENVTLHLAKTASPQAPPKKKAKEQKGDKAENKAPDSENASKADRDVEADAAQKVPPAEDPAPPISPPESEAPAAKEEPEASE